MGVEILNRARAAGLEVFLDAAGNVRVRGPRKHAALAAEVLTHRGEITAVLAGHRVPVASAPMQPAPAPVAFLDTIAAQHCHPAVLAARLSMPLEEVLRRLESSPWSGHGARYRARLGLGAHLRKTGRTEPPAPPEHDLHFPAR